jgi:RNA polymerase subunit RPABC4/transcription elongation factor Spt4
MVNACCVCLNEIELSDSVRSCAVCIDTHVCSACFDLMRPTNIHKRCPVCRCENWSNGADDLLIITDVDPFDSTTNGVPTISVSINVILDTNEEIVIHGGQPIRKLCLIIIKTIAMLISFWSIGFVMLSLAIDDFYRDNSLYVVIFSSTFAGFIVSAFALQFYMMRSI